MVIKMKKVNLLEAVNPRKELYQYKETADRNGEFHSETKEEQLTKILKAELAGAVEEEVRRRKETPYHSIVNASFGF